MSKYNNQGYLFFKNGKFTGKITVDGIERRIEGWWKQSKSGRKDELVSLAVKTEEEHQAGRKQMPKDKDYEYQELESLPEHQNGLGQDQIPF